MKHLPPGNASFVSGKWSIYLREMLHLFPENASFVSGKCFICFRENDLRFRWMLNALFLKESLRISPGAHRKMVHLSSGKWFICLPGKWSIYLRGMLHLFPENASFVPGRMLHLFPEECFICFRQNASFVSGKCFICFRKIVHLCKALVFRKHN